MNQSASFSLIVHIVAGFVLLKIANGFEAMGDLAPYAASGVSWDRLFLHLTALVLVIGAGVCFVRALLKLFGIFKPR